MAKVNKTSTTSTSIEAAASTLKVAFHQHTAITDNSKRGTGNSLCAVIRAMSAAGYARKLIAAMLAVSGVPVSPQTVTTQANAASGLKPGDTTEGHGPVPDMADYPAALTSAIEGLATALAAQPLAAINDYAKQLKGQRASMTPIMLLPAHLRPVA